MVRSCRYDPSNKTDSGGRMTRGEMYQSMGYMPRKRTCTEKVRYPRHEDALEVAREYGRRVIFAEMNVYRCSRHECWHIGHHGKHELATAKMLEYIKWFEDWGKRN